MTHHYHDGGSFSTGEPAIKAKATKNALAQAIDDLLVCWDDSADDLGPEWVGLAKHIERVRAASAEAAQVPFICQRCAKPITYAEHCLDCRDEIAAKFGAGQVPADTIEKALRAFELYEQAVAHFDGILGGRFAAATVAAREAEAALAAVRTPAAKT